MVSLFKEILYFDQENESWTVQKYIMIPYDAKTCLPGQQAEVKQDFKSVFLHMYASLKWHQ